MTQDLSFEIRLPIPYEEAVEKVVAALKNQGFGVLTRIDVKATLKEKIDIDFRPYVILGACNPPLAHKALSTDARVGLMLPCNVTVEDDPHGSSIIRIANPKTMIMVGELAEVPGLNEVTDMVYSRLERVAHFLEQK